MRLSPIAYYGDFVLFGLAIPAVAVAGIAAGQWSVAAIETVVPLTVAGAILWTLLEYLAHRYVFHKVPWIHELHEAHHHDQMALISVPTFASAAVAVVVVFLPLWLAMGTVAACGLTAGLMFGYLVYGICHHALHHWTFKPDGLGMALKRRHALHHHFDEGMNFGVTTGFWDKVFGTDVTPEVMAARRAAKASSEPRSA
jgi:sterol desaturase/sphingolipid hydroxylase (fatty acid hydroxylase superfamily)